MAENKEDIVSRLKRLRFVLKLKSGDFARGAGIDPRNYSSIENGKRTIGERLLVDIASSYNVNMQWLLTGEGEMLNVEANKEMYPSAFEQAARQLAKDFQLQYGDTEEGRVALEKFTEDRIMDKFKYARDVVMGMYEKGQIYSAAAVRQMMAERDEKLSEKDKKIEQLQRQIWELEDRLRKFEK